MTGSSQTDKGETTMRVMALVLIGALALPATAADVESRVLTHYLPQDLLETVVRTEAWTELKLDLKGGIRKGDVVRIWAGGSIDYGNGDQPGENISAPSGISSTQAAGDVQQLALSSASGHAFALLLKNEGKGLKKCAEAGKPLEIAMTKDNERLWIGFNDLRGRYQDNHLGKGRRHELDPLWLRVEVVRMIVD
jgi:hypothetical protein